MLYSKNLIQINFSANTSYK